MAIFHSYVSLPEGITPQKSRETVETWWKHQDFMLFFAWPFQTIRLGGEMDIGMDMAMAWLQIRLWEGQRTVLSAFFGFPISAGEMDLDMVHTWLCQCWIIIGVAVF